MSAPTNGGPAPEDVSPKVQRLRDLLAGQRAAAEAEHHATEGELAEQKHLMDPLDHALEALAPRTTTETSGSAL